MPLLVPGILPMLASALLAILAARILANKSGKANPTERIASPTTDASNPVTQLNSDARLPRTSVVNAINTMANPSVNHPPIFIKEKE